MTQPYRALAPAKVNLWLHVSQADATGYHPVRSLVAFADYGDEVTFTPSASGGLTLSIDGPFAEGLSTGADNLVLKAAHAFTRAVNLSCSGAFHLRKNLPAAAGLGGGSSDAGAALRILREVFAPTLSDAELEAIAATTGADGAMCLWAKACIAEGYGERLSPVSLPDLPAVLVNPGIDCPTGAVYKAFDEQRDRKVLGEDFPESADTESMIDYIAGHRNDLQDPAIRLKSQIGDVLTLLQQQPEALLTRMTGSGATYFALCQTIKDAENLSDRLQSHMPDAWIKACLMR